MPRPTGSGQLNLAEVFSRVQHCLLAELEATRSFKHPTAAGNATELLWRDLFNRYLPKRFSAAPVFVINSRGQCSRQIDLAIFDNQSTPLLFPHAAGDHIPIESVCAVFEIKQIISKRYLRDAGEKAASVRALTDARQRKRRPIIAGLLAASSIWRPDKFKPNVHRALESLPRTHALHYGCALEHGAFENLGGFSTAPANQALIFFLLRLIHQLNALGRPTRIELLDYLDRAKSKSPEHRPGPTDS